MITLRKTAIICALVMMISIIPAFALNQTNNTTGDQVQDANVTGNTTTTQEQQKNLSKNGNCGAGDKNCGTCDGEQHKYRYGQENINSGSGNCDQQQKHQYGQNNGNSGIKNCDGHNCQNSDCANKS